ncbi:helix-turn-helix domain-containing protein [Alkalilimnicola ehrlichii]|uniref:helix-turn-helix domain-containing protein n=1 Tax=Alkalilimnicola ehrlichii TaxID=351052 RepID=UPI003BA2C30A
MNTETNNPLSYSVNDACRALGIGRTTLYDEIKQGRLRALKVGRRTLIRHRDAEAWLNRLAEEQEAE